jgi:hypothetical protein
MTIFEILMGIVAINALIYVGIGFNYWLNSLKRKKAVKKMLDNRVSWEQMRAEQEEETKANPYRILPNISVPITTPFDEDPK